MALYNRIIRQLDKDGYTSELYRFQGGNSFNCIRSNKIDNSGYLYFSNSLDHHQYFTLKRIKQLLSKELQKEDLVLSSNNLQDQDTYSRIKKLVLNDENIKNLFSYKLIYDKKYIELIKDNYFYQDKKPQGAIEKVDRRVYGGGYGVRDEWKQLLSYLTLFTTSKEITREDLVEILINMRKTNKMNNKNNLDFFIKDRSRSITTLSDSLISDFTKYDIMNALESIMEKGLYNPNSELGKYPSKTIKEVVTHYQDTKEKTLQLLK